MPGLSLAVTASWILIENTVPVLRKCNYQLHVVHRELTQCVIWIGFALRSSSCLALQLPGPLSEDEATSLPGREHAHHLLSQREESAARAPLVVATLRALSSFSEDAFRQHLKIFFPLLTRLISYEHSPPEVQRALADIFTRRVAPLLQSG